MGEAKRRVTRMRELIAAAGEMRITDAERGDKFVARIAGSPSEFLAQQRELAARFLAGERPVATVLCNGCHACCRTQLRVPVDPSIEPTESLRHLDLVRDDEGLRLRKTADGSCVHLGPDGCTVYEHRPAACRWYDCRLFGLASIRTKPAANGACEPAWCFQPETPEDYALLMLAQLGVRQFIAKNPGSCNDGEMVGPALQFAQKHLPKAAAAIAELRALRAAKRRVVAEWMLGRGGAKR